jgi:hypothetical protein
MGTGVVTPGAKRPVHEADNPPPSVPRLRIGGAKPPLTQYAFISWCLDKHRNTFSFTFTLYKCLSEKYNYPVN